MISRPLKISYDKIKPPDYNKDSQIVYLVEDMEKTCRDGETDESNEYCVLSKSDTGNRNNIFSYNNERLNREIMERKIIIEDNSKIKDMVEEYLKKNEKKITLQISLYINLFVNNICCHYVLVLYI